MASRSNRQRKLERARAERRVARRAEQVRRKRQVQAGVGAAVALVLIVLGTVYVLGGFSPKPPETVASGSCTWTLLDPGTNENLVDTGHPPTDGELRSGFATLTLKTDKGDIQALMDLSKTPCTASSLSYLAGKKFYDGSICYQLDTVELVLTCGDPKNNGAGNPSYRFANELVPTDPVGGPVTPSPTPSPSAGASPLPTAQQSYYDKGTIVMVNTGAGTNGGQFYIVYGEGSVLSPAYTVVGHITKGLDIVTAVAAAGAVDDGGAAAKTGKPNQDLKITQVVVSETGADVPSGSPTPTVTAS